MKAVWSGFIWYACCALFLVSSTARYILIEQNRESESFISIPMIVTGSIMGIVYFFLILSSKSRIKKTSHYWITAFAFTNYLFLTIFQATISKEQSQAVFPTLFAMQLVIMLFSFISEIDFRAKILIAYSDT